MAKVVRYNVREETHTGDNVFLIHRPYIFSNPCTYTRDKKTLARYVVGSKEEAIRVFDKFFDVMLRESEEFRKEWDRMYEAYITYDTIYLGCYCGENDICHGDVIIEKLKRRSIKDMKEKLQKS